MLHSVTLGTDHLKNVVQWVKLPKKISKQIQRQIQQKISSELIKKYRATLVKFPPKISKNVQCQNRVEGQIRQKISSVLIKTYRVTLVKSPQKISKNMQCETRVNRGSNTAKISSVQHLRAEKHFEWSSVIVKSNVKWSVHYDKPRILLLLRC